MLRMDSVFVTCRAVHSASAMARWEPLVQDALVRRLYSREFPTQWQHVQLWIDVSKNSHHIQHVHSLQAHQYATGPERSAQLMEHSLHVHSIKPRQRAGVSKKKKKTEISTSTRNKSCGLWRAEALTAPLAAETQFHAVALLETHPDDIPLNTFSNESHIQCLVWLWWKSSVVLVGRILGYENKRLNKGSRNSSTQQKKTFWRNQPLRCLK